MVKVRQFDHARPRRARGDLGARPKRGTKISGNFSLWKTLLLFEKCLFSGTARAFLLPVK